jgi:hypothetical protein
LCFLLVVGFSPAVDDAHGQSGMELGIRVGDMVAADAAIPLAREPRLRPTVYFDNFGVAGYLDWLFRLSDGPAALRFYPGVGPEFFFENQFNLLIAGNFGLEWAFAEIPLTIGFDWRPALKLTNGTDFGTSNWGFTARFRLGKSKFEPA